MRDTSLLFGLLVFFPSLTQCTQLYVLTAPSVLRIEGDETAVVEAHGINKPLDVDIRLQYFPDKANVIFETSAILSSGNNYQASVTIKIPADKVQQEARLNQYVELEAVSATFTLKKVILVSYQIGHIFIQTDKPIYTPTQTVLYRLLTVNNELLPVKKNAIVEFMNPQNIVVSRAVVYAKDDTGITGHTFKIPEIVNIGVWKIVAYYKESNLLNYTTEFEVKEYVLPSFEVTIESEQRFFHIDDNKLDISITARFTYGKPVYGRAFVLFGIMKDGEKISIPASLQSVTITDGHGEVSLTRAVLATRFANIRELVGYSIYVTASVITHTGSDIVEAEKSGIKIVTSPYTMVFKKTSKYFKPGMPFDLMVYVTNPDGSPANAIPVTANNGASISKTQADGIARMTINTAGEPQKSLPITVETNAANIGKNRQASAIMVADPYQTKNGSINYLHIGIQQTELIPGTDLLIQLNLRNDNLAIEDQIKYFTYMLINKGKIVRVGRQLRTKGQIVALSIPVTANLIPSFRLLVYYYVTKGLQVEMVADSVWIDVKDTCMGTLRVSAASENDDKKIYKPGNEFKLKLTGDPGARVGLVAVDKAVFILNKKNKLTQSKIWSVVEKNDIGCTAGSGRDVVGVFSDAGLALTTSTAIKTLRRTACGSLMHHLESGDMIGPSQHGFVKGKSCLTNLLESFEDVSNRVDKGEPFDVVYLDFQQAFDKATHKRLCKVKAHGIGEMKCKQPMIRKRRETLRSAAMNVKRAEYKTRPQKDCCEQGMKRYHYSCHQRGRRVKVEACKTIFLDCCNHMKKFKFEHLTTTLARSDDDDYSAFENIISRSDFRESWLWLLDTLPTKVDRDGHATKEKRGYLKDSITTWEIQAVSVSSDKGICVAQPYELTVRKMFFIDLRLPYSVVRNEQVEIRAILYNYNEVDIKVRVEFPYNENICSGAKPTARFRQTVTVPGKGSTAVPFVIVPLKIGEVEIEVKASVYEYFVTDGVIKSLRVVPEGKKIERPVQTFILDPQGKELVIKVDVTVPDDVVPHTEPLTFISVQGELFSETIENSIDGAKLKHLIRVPTGCGEQNMASMTPGVIVTNYLDKTQQWEKVGMDRRANSLKNIQLGYTQQLAYRKDDGSYAAFTNREASTWLTAYVVKVFAMSYRLTSVDPKVLCGAVKWLILYKQKPDGHFHEDAPVIMGAITGGVHGAELDASLTAFVLIAMLEAKTVCAPYIESYENSVRKAGDYLDNHIGGLKRVYSVAITTYALSLLHKNKLDILMKFASPDQSYWAEAGNVNSLYTIEATGYSLLAFLQLEQFEQAGKLVRWLSLRSEYGGGYSSTQATMVALQGLAKYMTDVPQFKDVDLKVVLAIPSRSMPINWAFDTTNTYVAKSEKISAYEKFVVKANGTGQGILKVLTSYHALLSVQAEECKEFDLNITVKELPRENRHQDAESSIMISICARYLGETNSSMVIVDISMLTGFSPDIQSLDLLKNEIERYISQYELDKALSTKGSLIIYLDSVSNLEETCFAFKAHQHFKVGLIQPASVKIYEYYDTPNSCTKFYHVNKSSSMLSRICKGDVCRCAEGSCVSVKLPDEPISSGQRDLKACHHGIDFVYQVTFLDKRKKDSYIYYTMKILTVIKQGSDGVQNGQERQLITHSNCKDTFDVELDKYYLIMGQGSDLWLENERISYLIGSETWIERWPNEAECQQDLYSQLCLDLTEFKENLRLHGCDT